MNIFNAKNLRKPGPEDWYSFKFCWNRNDNGDVWMIRFIKYKVGSKSGNFYYYVEEDGVTSYLTEKENVFTKVVKDETGFNLEWLPWTYERENSDFQILLSRFVSTMNLKNIISVKGIIKTAFERMEAFLYKYIPY